MNITKGRTSATGRVDGTAAQGLVEFALTLPILLVIVIGALDFGMAFYAKVVLTNSAREGANYMVYNAGDVAGTKTAVQMEGANSGVVIDAADIQVQCLVGGVPDVSCPPRSTAVVTVSHDMPLLVDVIFSGPLQLNSQARMLIP